VQEIARENRPVVSEDMVLLMRAGHEVPIEPAIARELALTGQWDQSLYLKLLDRHAFGFVITTPDDPWSAERYTPDMLAAIARDYPRTEAFGPYLVHYPQGQ
jgi:hypothetical protein